MTDQALTARDLFAAVAAQSMYRVLDECILQAAKKAVNLPTEFQELLDAMPCEAFAFADKMMAERAMTQPGGTTCQHSNND